MFDSFENISYSLRYKHTHVYADTRPRTHSYVYTYSHTTTHIFTPRKLWENDI